MLLQIWCIFQFQAFDEISPPQVQKGFPSGQLLPNQMILSYQIYYPYHFITSINFHNEWLDIIKLHQT